MAAYVTMARIDRVKPQLAGRVSAGPAVWPASEALVAPEAIELVSRPLLPLVAERWTALREAWAQTTFYLFDAEGWR